MSKLIEYITNDGYRLLARSLTGECTIDFTKVQMGDGNASSGDLRRATRLSHVCVEIPVDTTEIESDNTVVIGATFSNEELTTGFYYKEKGVWASDGANEVLFSYAYNSEGTWIPPFTEEIIEKRIKSICTQLQDVVTPINIRVKSGIYATTEDLGIVSGRLQELLDTLKQVAYSASYNDLIDRPSLGTAADKNVAETGNAENNQVVMGNDSRLSDSRPAADVYEWAKQPTKPTYNKSEIGLGNVDNTSDIDKPVSTAVQNALNQKLSTSLKGTTNGLAELDANGLVPASQLPSYVDDVLEGTAQGVTKTGAGTYSATGFILKGQSKACTPEEGKTYVDTTSNIQYRWSGSAYVSMGSNLVLGETSDTAYRGDRGKIAYDHSQSAHLGLGETSSTAYRGDRGKIAYDHSQSAHLGLGETSSTAYRGDRGKAAYDHSISDHGGVTPAFTQATSRANISSGETLKVILGKISRYFADLGAAAFMGTGTTGSTVALGNHSHSDKLGTSGNSQSCTVTYTTGDTTDANVTKTTGWTSVSQLTSGLTHTNLFNRISTMMKNVRWLYKLIGTTDISTIGDGTVRGAISELNNNLPTYQSSNSWEYITFPGIRLIILTAFVNFTYNGSYQSVVPSAYPIQLKKLLSTNVNGGVSGRADTSINYVKGDLGTVQAYILSGGTGTAWMYFTIIGLY